jgi:hypothetical protein
MSNKERYMKFSVKSILLPIAALILLVSCAVVPDYKPPIEGRSILLSASSADDFRMYLVLIDPNSEKVNCTDQLQRNNMTNWVGQIIKGKNPSRTITTSVLEGQKVVIILDSIFGSQYCAIGAKFLPEYDKQYEARWSASLRGCSLNVYVKDKQGKVSELPKSEVTILPAKCAI